MLNTKKYVMQIDESDCGIAAFSTILKHFNIHIPYHRLKFKFENDINGISIGDILAVSENMGIQGVGMNGSMVNLLNFQDLRFPFIAHAISDSNMQHFIVVTKINNKKVYIFDPGIGKCTISYLMMVKKKN